MVVRALLSLAILTVLGCEVLSPTNPFDPNTPADQQEPGAVVGRVVLEGRDLASQPVTLRVLQSDGREVTVGAGARPTTRDGEAVVPEGLDGDAAGTFEIALVPGSYRLAFVAADNGGGGFADVEVPFSITAGERVRRDLTPTRQVGGFVGSVAGRVDTDDATAVVVVTLRPAGPLAADPSLQQRAVVVGSGAFTFSNVPPASYAIQASATGTAPASSPVFAVQDAPVEVEPLTLVALGELFSVVEHGDNDDLPPFAPFLPSLSVTLRVNTGLLLLAAGDTVEVRAAEQLAPDAGFSAATGDVSVTLADGDDGPRTVQAELRVCFAGRCVCDESVEACGDFVSPLSSGAFAIPLVVDRVAPEALSVTLDGVAGPLLLSCATFGGSCPPAPGTPPRVPALDATIVDVTGRVISFSATLDDAEAGAQTVVAAASGVARIRGIGPAITPDNGSHTSRIFATDAAGNVGVVDERTVTVDVTPPPTPSLLVDGAGLGAVVRRQGFVTIDVASAEAPARWRLETSGGTAVVAGPNVGVSVPYTGPVQVAIDGDHQSARDLVAVVEDTAGNTARSAAVVITVEAVGDAVGRFVLDGRQGSSTQNGGIQVTVLDGADVAVATTTTAADGSWNAALVVGTDYRALAFFPGFVGAESGAFAISDEVTTVVDADAGGAPTAGVLGVDDGVLALCRPTAQGLASEPCAGVSVVNVTRLQVSGISFDGVTDTRVSTTAFNAGDVSPAFVPVVGSGATVVAPTVDLPAVDGAVTVFFQTRSGANVSEVQRAIVTLDRAAPSLITLTLARGEDALRDGLTRSTVVRATVDVADADAITACAAFAIVAPTTLPAGAVCSSIQNRSVELDVTMASSVDGVQRAFAFACDGAGNCSTAPAATAAASSIVLDRTPPTLGSSTGASFAVSLPAGANDGVRFHVNSRVHEVAVVPGTSVLGGTETAGVRLATDASAVSTAAITGLGATGAAETARVRTPEFLGSDGDDYTVFAILVDGAGNETPAPLSHGVHFDTTPPRLVVSLPSFSNDALGSVSVVVVDSDSDALASLTATVTQAGASRTTVLSSPPAVSVNTTLQLSPAGSGVGDGPVAITLTARDRAGNASTDSRSVLLDRAAPQAPSITSPTSNEHSADTTPTWRFTTVADAASYEVRVLQGAATVRGPTTTLSTELTESIALPQANNYVLDVRARDAAGNSSSASTVAFVIDTTQPGAPTGLTINGSAAALTTNDNTPTVSSTIVADNFTANAELRATVLVATDVGFTNVVFSAQRLGIGAFSVTTPPLGDGAYLWRVVVSDKAGNVRTVDGPALTIDATVPQAPVLTGVSSPRNASSHTWSSVADATRFRVRFDVVDSGAGDCSGVVAVDRADITVTAFTPTVPATVDGCLVQFRVAAIDAAGNESPSATVAYLLDTEVPTTPLFVIDGGPITNRTTARLFVTPPGGTGSQLTLEFAILEGARSGGACAPAVVPNAAFTTPTATVLPSPTVDLALPGDDSNARRCKTIGLRARDAAGNISGQATARVVELDQTAPTQPRFLTTSTTLNAPNGIGAFALELAAVATDANLDRHELIIGGVVTTATPTTAGACAGSVAAACVLVTLPADTETRFVVRARDLAGNLSETDFVALVDDSSPPAIPQLEARAGDAEVRLSWPAVSDVDHFNLLYAPKIGATCPTDAASYTGTAAEQGPSPINIGRTATSAVLSGLPNRFALCVALQAVDAIANASGFDATCGDGCNVISATPQFLPVFVAARLTATQLGLSSTQRAQTVAARRGLLYVATAGGGLLELDTTNPACADIPDAAGFKTCTGLVSSLQHPTVPEGLTDPRQVVLQGGFAFVADGTAGLKIFRLKEGTPPQRVVSLGNTGGQASLSVAVSGNAMAVGHASTVVRGNNGFVELFDLAPVFAATPAAPTLRSTINQSTPNGGANPFNNEERGIFGVSTVDIQGTTLAMGSFLVNITNLAAPTNLVQPIEGNAVVRLAGQFLIAAKDDNGPDNDLHVVDLGACIGTCPVVSRSIGVASRSLELVGPYIVATGRGRVDIYDFSDRTSIDLVASHTAANQSSDIVELGGTAISGNRAYVVTGNTNPFVDVLEFGEMTRLDGLAVEGVPFGAFDAAVVDNVLIQGRAQAGNKGNADQAVTQLQRGGLVADQLATPDENVVSVAADGRQILFVDNDATLGSRVHTFTRSGAGLSARITRNVAAAAEGARTYVGGTLSWPFAVAVSGANDRALDLVVTQMVNNTTTIARITTRATPLGLSNEFTQERPAVVSIYGGFVYVGFSDRPFAAGTAVADQGVWRVPFDPGSGTLGVPLQLTSDPVSSLRVDGRKVVYTRNTAARVTAIRTIDGVGAVGPEVVLTTGTSFNAPLTLAGDTLFIPADVQGLQVFRLGFTPGTSTPTANATRVVEMNYGAEAQRVHVVLDRVYAQSIGSATFVLRAR
jgi:hypothetical protein